jgi:hypothetical protein
MSEQVMGTKLEHRFWERAWGAASNTAATTIGAVWMDGMTPPSIQRAAKCRPCRKQHYFNVLEKRN